MISNSKDIKRDPLASRRIIIHEGQEFLLAETITDTPDWNQRMGRPASERLKEFINSHPEGGTITRQEGSITYGYIRK